ncbi:MAG: phosphoglycerate mutase family protein [Chloroflexota bacterium]|nr:phosphoglycerate mutase family protein [Chloroflexota bacterium]
MAKLVLVKHSNSNHNPAQPAQDWELTPEGYQRCQPLAKHLASYRPRRLFCSSMPKALQTARSVAERLENIPVIENPLLAEHSRRTNAPYGSIAAFEARMRRLFDAPDELVFGDETANQARGRFQRGILPLIGLVEPTENIVVIAHGTVAVLFAAHYNTIDPYDLWRKLKMPSCIEMETPDFRICQVIEDAGID